MSFELSSKSAESDMAHGLLFVVSLPLCFKSSLMAHIHFSLFLPVNEKYQRVSKLRSRRRGSTAERSDT